MGEKRRLEDRKFLISAFLLSFLLILFGCSSFFSFSWNTEKEVKGPSSSKTRKVRNVSVQPPSTVPSHGGYQKASGGSALYELQITRLPQKTPEALERFFGQLKEHGIRTVYFRVFQNPGDGFFEVLPVQAKKGVYFKTSHAPLVSDLLPLVCRFAHENDIKIYAWMNTLKAEFLWCREAKHTYRFVPSQGRLERTSRWSPHDPRVLAAVSGLFADLARNPIDGILLQDDLILHYNEDLGLFARKLFMKSRGLETFAPEDLYEFDKAGGGKTRVKGYTPLFWAWSRWKCEELSLFMAKLKKAVKAIRPEIKFAVDVNYEALLAPEDALAWYSRSIEEMERIVAPDRYVVMSYQRQMQRELEEPETVILGYIREMVTTALKLAPGPNRWVFKVQTIDWRTREPIVPDQIRMTVETIESVAPVRACLMPYTPQLFKVGLLARLGKVRD